MGACGRKMEMNEIEGEDTVANDTEVIMVVKRVN